MKKIFNKFFNKKSRLKPQDGIFYSKISNLISNPPNDIEVYQTAFTHRSAQKRSKKGEAINFERLEFLGDAILGSVVAVYLYHSAPTGDEGYLTKMRSKFVSRNHLNAIGGELGISELLITDQNNKLGENINGNLLEALIGAIYIDLGFDYAEAFIYKHIIKKYKNLAVVEKKIASYKGLLHEFAQKEKKVLKFASEFDTKNKKKPLFITQLFLDDKLIATAKDKSKKQSEEMASKMAYQKLGLEKKK